MSDLNALKILEGIEAHICKALSLTRGVLKEEVKKVASEPVKILAGQIWGRKSAINDDFNPPYIVIVYPNQPNDATFHGYFQDNNLPKRMSLPPDKIFLRYTLLPHKQLAFINKVID